ncbi:NADH dehydrogenase [ubiquinone] flavoprotein 3, mitochondrial isoform X1 [Trichechus manatus latirostris]|uniref:NADH dehydrogenase [ubiquinone] flavoprotein 3, mitochondrial isoform X1 n=1 Tax=Trichechus manatus latirostris TaxID=127582 RepID=A0A2Y9RT93_TRIMA|nr:NADH dehydrogenase [ubiquinone] flavoprotein 3, mitochondrial isoform X1 [Trichechus manatus latirostris]
MAAQLLLQQGRAGALKTGLQAGALRGLASTVPLSAESGKSGKGLPPNPKKQSKPKHVVEAKAKGKLLAPHPAAGLSKKFSPPSAYPSVTNEGGMVASPDPDDVMLLTDEGGPRFLARKTLVAFPQKVASPFRKQGPELETHQRRRKAAKDSASSSSSSSDSESDEEEGVSEVGPRVASKAQGRFQKSQASFEDRTPKIVIAAKEKTWPQKPHTDSTYPEKPYQPEKKTVSQSEVDEGVMKQYVKEKQSQKIFRLNEIDKESQKPVERKQNLPDHTDSGLSSQPSPVPTLLAEETEAEKQLQAAPSETREKNVEEQVPEPKWKVASPQFREENLGEQVVVGNAKAARLTKEIVVEDGVPVGSLKAVPAQNKDISNEKIPVLHLEEKGEIIQDSATQTEDPDNVQETEQAAAPAGPSDITTYKNLQHHDYNAYTFLDLNLELSKFRMPQPSSGRESPRH